jgi:hypothetical protein
VGNSQFINHLGVSENEGQEFEKNAMLDIKFGAPIPASHFVPAAGE